MEVLLVAGIILSAMADDGPLGHVDHILGDVGGKVADALQVAGDQEEVNEGLYLLWVFFNITLDVKEYLLVEGVNLIVGGAYLLGHTGVHLYERIQSLLYHGYDLLTHFREIEKKLSPLPVSKIGGPLSDVNGQITHAFQVIVHLQDSHNIPQINGRRLVKSEDLEAVLLYLDLYVIYLMVTLHHLFCQLCIVACKRKYSLLYAPLHHGAQGEDLLSQFIQFSFQMSLHSTPFNRNVL